MERSLAAMAAALVVASTLLCDISVWDYFLEKERRERERGYVVLCCSSTRCPNSHKVLHVC